MSYPPYNRGGHPIGHGHPRSGPPRGYYGGPSGHHLPPMPFPDYDDVPSSFGMRGLPGPSMGNVRGGRGRGGGFPRQPPIPGAFPGQAPLPGPGLGRATGASASDTEGGSGSGVESSPETPAPKPIRKTGGETGIANDCEIVVLNKAQQKYAEAVERQLRENGLQVELRFPKSDIKIVEFLKPIAKLGTIFAVVIDPECERERNIHFYQFRGVSKAQYHKNVPLAQAYNLINRIYKELKLKEIGAIPDKINGLLAKLQEEQYLEDEEYSALIQFLQERRSKQNSFLSRTSSIIQEPKNDVNSLVESPDGKKLQKKILTLLNEA